MRRALTIFIAVLATALFPAGAAAAEIVPPENSAVNQYTEGFPTGGGETKTTPADRRPAKPGTSIGAQNAHKLEQKGSEGRAAAEVAAETAPLPVSTDGESATSGGDPGPQKQDGEDKAGGAGGVAGGGAGGTGTGGGTTGGNGSGGSAAAAPSGDSALGSLTSAATGTDSGNLGVLLPLILLAILAWGCAYALRQRKRSATQ